MNYPSITESGMRKVKRCDQLGCMGYNRKDFDKPLTITVTFLAEVRNGENQLTLPRNVARKNEAGFK